MTYRKDIDGLRALAIGLVMAFHLYPGVLAGGFIGVDVFFVISGYLITGILLESYTTGSFSFRHFYGRRARRLLPSLLPVLVFCLVAGFIFQTPAQFYQLSKHILGGLLFVANFTLWSDAGYFNPDQDSNPVLHLWSLGIEEQFYLVWPVLLLGIYRYARRYLAATLMALLLVSFGLNVMLVRSLPDVVFYFPVTRFWQIGAGALLVIWQQGRTSLPDIACHSLSVTGLACILLAAVSVSSNTWYPGWWGLLPVIGTVLLLQAGPGGWINSRVLSHPLLVWTGLISYPLYLWHWPLLVFANSANIAIPAGWLKLLVILGSLLLAWASYRLLELPARRAALPRMIRYCLSGSVVIFMAAWATWFHQGWSARQPGGMAYPAKIAALGAPGFDDDIAAQWRENTCFLGRGQGAEAFTADCLDYRGTDKLVFLWGDSHAAAFYPGLLSLAKDAGFGIAQYTANSCPPVLDWQGTINPLCRMTNDDVLTRVLQSRPDVLVLHAAWYMGDYADMRLGDTLQRLREAGIGNIVVIGPPPLWADSVPFLIFDHYRQNSEILPPYSDRQLVWRTIEEVEPEIRATAEAQGATYLSLTDVLCNGAGCRLYFDDLLDVTSVDSSHLTPHAAEVAAGLFASALTPR